MKDKSGEATHFADRWSRLLSNRDRSGKFYTSAPPTTQTELFFQRYFMFVADLIGTRSGDARIAEVGCGRGTTSLYLAKASGTIPFLIDASPGALLLARRNFSEENVNPRCLAGDAVSLPLRDGSLDVIFSIGLLEHFTDVSEPMKEMVRVLAPGGLFISLNIPKIPFNLSQTAMPVNLMLRIATRIINFRPRTIKKAVQRLSGVSPAHAQLFRNDYPAAHYKKVAEDCGLVEVQVVGANPFPHFAPLPPRIDRWITNRYSKILSDSSKSPFGNPFLTDLRRGSVHFVWGLRK